MANSYNAGGKYFDIDTDMNVAGMIALKGGAPAGDETIYISEAATLTVEQDLDTFTFYTGDNQAGIASVKKGNITFLEGTTTTLYAGTNRGFWGEGSLNVIQGDGGETGLIITCNDARNPSNNSVRNSKLVFRNTTFEKFNGFFFTASGMHDFQGCTFVNCNNAIYQTNTSMGLPTSLDGCVFIGCSRAIYDNTTSDVLDWDDFFKKNEIKVVATSTGSCRIVLGFNQSDVTGLTRYFYGDLQANSIKAAPAWDTTEGVQSLIAGSNGTLGASWNAAADANGKTVRYRVYVRKGAAPDTFGLSSPYLLCETLTTGIVLASYGDGAPLVDGEDVYVIVRAATDVGDEDENVVTQDAEVILSGDGGGNLRGGLRGSLY